MCGSEGGQKLDWQKELPQEEGDWLWIAQWDDCGCVHKFGLAWVVEYEEEPITGGCFCYRLSDGRKLSVHWGHHTPTFYDGMPYVDQWARIELPEPSCEASHNWGLQNVEILPSEVTR